EGPALVGDPWPLRSPRPCPKMSDGHAARGRPSEPLTGNGGGAMNRRKRILRRTLVAFVGVAAICMGAYPTVCWSQEVKVTLSGSQEVPPVTTSATGSGTITVGDDRTVSGSVTTTGVVGVAAHIHQAAPGQNGSAIIPLTKSGDSGW